MKAADWIDRVKKVKGWESDYRVAKERGFKANTISTYRKTGNAPRSVQLALFWETRWGRSAADTEAANWGAMYYREATMARRELDRMASIIARLELEISQGSGSRPANLPIFRIR